MICILGFLAAFSPAAASFAQPSPVLAFEAERLPYRVEPLLVKLAVGADGRLYAMHAVDLSGGGPLLILDSNSTSVEARPLTVDGKSIAIRQFGWRADTLWVIDGSGSRLILFDTQERRIAERAVPVVVIEPPLHPGVVHALLPEGEVLLMTAADAAAHWPREPPPGALFAEEFHDRSADDIVRALPLLRVSSSGAVVDTTAWQDMANFTMVLFARSRTPGRSVRTRGVQPFADHALFEVHPSGEWLAAVERSASGPAPHAYAVHIIDSAGDTIRSGTYSYSPVPLPRDVVEMEMLKRASALTDDRAEAREIARPELYAPPFYPPVSRILLGPEGWIWVRREDVRDAPRISWDLIDPDGRRVGSISVPSALRLRAVRDLEGWATEHAESGDTHLWHLVVRISG